MSSNSTGINPWRSQGNDRSGNRTIGSGNRTGTSNRPTNELREADSIRKNADGNYKDIIVDLRKTECIRRSTDNTHKNRTGHTPVQFESNNYSGPGINYTHI